MSSPMIAWAPTASRVYKYLTTRADHSKLFITLDPTATYDIETSPDKRDRTLKHLLRANHVNHAILFNNLRFHNHTSHLLGSAYIFGASPAQLNKIYESESVGLDPWAESPAEVTDQDWRAYLGDKRYQRAYVDFFEDELALKHGYDWKAVVDEYLYKDKEPLINGIIGGLGHAVIHLGYAFELNTKELAMEAMSMVAISYSPLHKYLDDPSFTKPSTYSTASPLEILHKVAGDSRFDNIFESPGSGNVDAIFENPDAEAAVLEHWNAWNFESDPTAYFRDSQEAAAALLVNTVKPGTHSYDFFLVHVLTTSHAIRILLPSVPKRFHINLVRQWWLLTIAVYVAQLRPAISADLETSPGGKGWNYVDERALTSSWSTDAHYVKALRAMKSAAFTWGDVHERYLSAAVIFADDFRGWTGFATNDHEAVDEHGGEMKSGGRSS